MNGAKKGSRRITDLTVENGEGDETSDTLSTAYLIQHDLIT